MDIANLVIRVTNDGLTAAQRELRRLRDEVNRNVDANKKMREGLDDLSKWAAIGLGALGGVTAVATKKAMSFETAMAEVNKTVDFTTKNGLADLRVELEGLAKTMPLAFEELAAIAASGGQAGVADTALKGFTETIAKMSIAFDISADETATSMAKIASAYKIPIESISDLGDAINTVSNSTAARADELVDFMLRVGQSANNFHIAGEAAAAMGGALIDAGGRVEVVGTAMTSVFKSMADVEWVKANAAAFQDIGLNTEKYLELMKTDGLAAFNLLREAVMKSEDPMALLGELFDNAGGHVAELFQENSKLVGILDSVGQGAEKTKDHIGSLDKEYKVMADTSANAFKLVSGSMDLVMAAIGEAFLPAVRELTDVFIPLIQQFSEWAKANPELVRQIALVAATVLGSIVSIKLFADGVEAAVTTFENLKTAFGIAKSALTILTGGFALPLLAIAALIAAGVLLYQNWDLVKEKASELNEWVKSKFGSLPEPLQQAGRDIAQVFKFIWDAGREYLTLMSELYSGTFESFATIATGAFQAVWTVIKTAFSGIVNIISGSLQVVATLFSGGFALIKNTVSMVLGVIKAVISGDFKAIPGIIGNGLKGALSIVGNMMGQILDIIKNYGKRLYSIGRDFISGFIKGIGSMASGAASAAATMAGNAIEAVRKRQQSNSPAKATIKLGKDLGDGYIGGIKSKAKAVKTEAQKMAESAIEAVDTGIARIKKELALFGNNSNLADLEYDIAIGKYNGVSEAKKNEYRNVTAELEAKSKLAAANKTVQDSIDGLVKQQALFNNSSALASLMYDIDHTKKFKDVSEELREELIKQTRAWEQLGMTAKATAAIQSRFAQLAKDKESSSTNLQGMLLGLEAASPLGKIEAEYEARNAIIEKYEQTHTDMINVANEARLASDQAYMDAKRDLMLDQGEAIFGNLAGLSKAFLGEQSGMYKALFAIEKGYTLAKVLLKNKEAIAEAWASAPFPANLGAVASTVAGTAGLASAVSGIMPGFKQGGYTGNMGASQVAGVVHGQEYVFDAQATKRIGVDNLNAMRSGKAPAGGDVSINIINNSSARVEASDDGKTITITDVNNAVDRGIKRSWTNTGNPNSFESKQLNRNLQAPRRR